MPPLPSKPVVRLIPNEFATDVAVSERGHLGITIHSYTRLEPSTLEHLATQVHLSTWPQSSNVSFTTSVSNDHTNDGDYAAIFVEPGQPLTDGWYKLSIEPLDRALQWPVYPNFSIDANGAASSRFHVGSDPTVLSVRVCTNEKTSESKVMVDFSEPVKLLGPTEQTLRVTPQGGGAECTMHAPMDQQGIGISTASFACSGLATNDTLRVQLSDAFASLDAPSLPVSGSTIDIELSVSELPPIGQDCGVYYVQRHLHDDP
jgi:hypothetical protein